MKRFAKFALAAMMALSMTACGTSGGQSSESSSGALFKAGTYEAEAEGFGGSASPIHLSVTLSEDKIESIEFTADGETPTVGGAALPKLVDSVIAAQSPNIDGVSGATITSTGFFTALNDAISQSGADPSKLEPQDTGKAAAEDIEKEADIVIAGAGGAGMTAAITAAQAGKKVIILEKGAVSGGNSSYATGGMNAADTHYQAEQGIEDSADLYYADTMKGGHDLNNPDLVRTLADNSSAAIDWLDSIGAPLSNVGQAGGASAMRQHRPVNDEGKILSVGTYLVEHLTSTCEQYGVEIIYGAKVDRILVNEGKAAGLHATGTEGNSIKILAEKVIIATGGFGSNPEMIVRYRPDLEGYVSTNAPTITGDLIPLLEQIGADFVDLEQIQVHPTVVQKDGALISESLRGDGAILLNKYGQRFTDEMNTRDYVSARISEQDDSYAWLIADQKMADESTVVEKYYSKGYMIQCDTLADLAKLIGCEESTLEETFSKWQAAVAAQKDDEFEHEAITSVVTDLSHAPYYAVQIAPGIHHCMGGVKINTNAEVIDTEGNVIENLYAAGEVTGGVHGGNRLGGNAVADFVVFGRIAGENASK